MWLFPQAVSSCVEDCGWCRSLAHTCEEAVNSICSSRAAPQASTMRIGCGIVGSKTFPGTARLWLVCSESTSLLAVSVAVLNCGALVMRSGGVCMIVANRMCITAFLARVIHWLLSTSTSYHLMVVYSGAESSASAIATQKHRNIKST